MSDSPSIAVIIVAYNGAHWIPECLETLRKASREPVRLCLVDNSGNGDAIPARLDGFELSVLQTPDRLGFAEANNFALRQFGLNSEYVCFLNQDTRSASGWLDQCAAALARAPEVGAVSPVLKTYDARGWDPGFLECVRSCPALMRDISNGAPQESVYLVPKVTAAAMFVRTRVLRQVGPFDPIFGSYYEDYDLCRRIRQAGHQIGIVAQAIVCHYSGSSATSEPARRKRMRQVIRNRTILGIREAGEHRWREIARYLACTMPYNFGRSMFRTPSSQPLPVQLHAHWELLGQWRRLVSERHDRRLWTEYLNRIGWLTEATTGLHDSHR